MCDIQWLKNTVSVVKFDRYMYHHHHQQQLNPGCLIKDPYDGYKVIYNPYTLGITKSPEYTLDKQPQFFIIAHVIIYHGPPKTYMFRWSLMVNQGVITGSTEGRHAFDPLISADPSPFSRGEAERMA